MAAQGHAALSGRERVCAQAVCRPRRDLARCTVLPPPPPGMGFTYLPTLGGRLWVGGPQARRPHEPRQSTHITGALVMLS